MTAPAPTYYLLRYFRKGGEPFADLRDAPEDKIAAPGGDDANYSFGRHPVTGRRLPYQRARVEVEGWLHDMGAERGLHVDADHPVYFYLSRDANPSPPIRDGECVALALQDIPPGFVARMTATFGDSFPALSRADASIDAPPRRDPREGRLFTLYEAIESLERDGPPAGRDQAYVEVQFWSRNVDGLRAPKNQAAQKAAQKRQVSPSLNLNLAPKPPSF